MPHGDASVVTVTRVWSGRQGNVLEMVHRTFTVSHRVIVVDYREGGRVALIPSNTRFSLASSPVIPDVFVGETPWSGSQVASILWTASFL